MRLIASQRRSCFDSDIDECVHEKCRRGKIAFCRNLNAGIMKSLMRFIRLNWLTGFTGLIGVSMSSDACVFDVRISIYVDTYTCIVSL